MSEVATSRYHFGTGARVGVLLGLSLRQALPIVLGVLFLTVMLMAQLPLIGMVGPVVGCVVSFGRWRRAPLFEVATPGARLAVNRWRRRVGVDPYVTDGLQHRRLATSACRSRTARCHRFASGAGSIGRRGCR